MKNLAPNIKENGFTLIELVMVIVILGILAAFALPRFADLGGEARGATLEGAAASVKSASAIAHSKWLAAGKGSEITMEDGTKVAMDSNNGYPTAAAGGIDNAAQLDSGEFKLTPDTSNGTALVTVDGHTSNPADSCQFTYTQSTGAVSGLKTNGC